MNNALDKKREAYRLGQWAETLVCIILRLKGYKILHRRYKTPMGEIDIIASNRKMILMVEVKARRDKRVEEVLTWRQKQRICRASLLFLAKNSQFESHQLRYDLAIVHAWLRWRYIKNAWDFDVIDG